MLAFNWQELLDLMAVVYRASICALILMAMVGRASICACMVPCITSACIKMRG
jgi:hypothetical protein